MIEAVRGVDIEVRRGEIVGFLGPSGAGKTTTLKMLATLLDPTGGSATVAGSDLRRDSVGVRRRIGYVSQAGSTSPEALVGEEIVDHARLYGIAPSVSKARAEELLARPRPRRYLGPQMRLACAGNDILNLDLSPR